ncbi:MAG: amidohydrolase family protein [Phycisphaerae bacterium]|nr:amidohydrolase family protein [Phycisphaerae bacterium]
MKIINCHAHYNFVDPSELEEKRRTVWDGLGYSQVWFSGNNRSVRELFRRYPDYAVGLAAVKLEKGAHWRNPEVEPEHVDNSDDVVRYRDQGFAGLKVMYVGHPFSHPSYLPIYERAAELRMPILFHTGYTSSVEYQDYYRPSHLIDIGQRVPELRIIAAHLGGQFFWETIWAMSKCPNVYADLSGGTVRYFPAEFFRMLFLRVRRNDTTGSAVVDPDSADDQPCPPIRKLVFGSDNPDDTLEFYRQFMIALDVPAENRELIYHGNAEKLLAT